MTEERWQKFSTRDQIGHIASEIYRAQSFEDQNKALFDACLEKAIALVDLTLSDPKWHNNAFSLLFLRQELAKFYIGETKEISRLYAAL